MLTFKVLSVLSSYPTRTLLRGLDSLAPMLDADLLLPRERREALGGFFDWLRQAGLIEAQAAYVDLFERSPGLSLHLFAHLHPEARARGQARHRLAALYRENGMPAAPDEPPDHLPRVLDFLAGLAEVTARTRLAEFAPVILTIEQRLRRRGSAYAAVLAAVASLVERRAAAAPAAGAPRPPSATTPLARAAC
jgi:nitrate reductase molybdenum cofactor assembly chaperone NarJ/NarW